MKKQITFLASLFLAFSMSLSAADINVTPEQVLQDVIATAAEGDVLILADGTYAVIEEDVVKKHTINIEKSITIKATNKGMAKLAGYYFVVPADIEVKSFVIDGIDAVGHDATTGDYFLQVNTGTSTLETVQFLNSSFADFGRGVLRGTTEGDKITNILIDNCIFTNNSLNNAGYNTINPQKATCESIIIKNSTFYNQPSGILRVESSTALTLLVQNCTVLACGSATGSQNMISAKGLVAGSKVEKCIFSGAYVAPEDLLDKAINLNSAENGIIDNCLLEGYSAKLVDDVLVPSLTKGATVTNPIESTVKAFDFETLKIDISPATTGIGDPRWTVGEITTDPDPNSVPTIDANKIVRSVEYFDLTGKRSHKAAKGLLIEKTTYTDGTTSSQKVWRNEQF